MRIALPTTLDDAVELLAEQPERHVLAGGTDVMVEVNYGLRRPESVLSLRRIDELRSIERDGPDLLVGAMVTYTRLLDEPVSVPLPALAQAARTVGSPQIRNTGTIGGNLATGSPAGDTLPVLIALDAKVELSSATGDRSIPVGTFLQGPKQTALAPGELIRAVRIPIPTGPQEFLKVGTRNAMVISVASCAVVVDVATRSVRCGLGSVGPTPLRCPEAERWAADRLDWARVAVAERAVHDHFGRLAASSARPIDDHRSTAAYRTHAVEVLAARGLARCAPIVVDQ